MRNPPEHIAILKLSSIGDCVLASAVPRALKKHDENRVITWIVEKRCSQVVEGNPDVNDVLIVDDPLPASLIRAGRELRKRSIDVLLDLQGILKTSILVAISGARRRITSNRSRTIARLAANQVYKVEDGLHATHRYIRCASAIGCDTSDIRLSIPITAEDRTFAAHFITAHQSPFTNHHSPIVGINPGASRDDKRWPPERFAQVADTLMDQNNVRVILFGGTGDASVCEQVKRTMINAAIDASGKTTLRQFAALADRCAVLISNDTGPMHIAAAVGTRIVAVFGASNPGFTGPFGNGHVVLWKAKNWDDARTRGIELLQAISCDEVINSCTEILRAYKTNAVH